MPAYIAPLDPPFEPEVAEELSRQMGRSDRPPLLLFRTLAKHLPLARAWATLGSHNLARGALPVRHRELIILRTCYLNGCEYEWGVHVKVYAKAAGLAPEQWAATARPSFEHESWSGQDRAVLAFADALHASARVPRELLEQLRIDWDERQLLEACEVAGFYHGVAYMANVAEVQLEEWGERFPAQG
jgi:alkylhydroperoxidase family enzyme